ARDRDREDAAIGHRLGLATQRGGLRAGLPGVQDFLARGGRLQSGQAVVDEVDARRNDQLVVCDRGATAQRHLASGGVYLRDPVAYPLHTVLLLEVRVRHGDVVHLASAADDEVGDRAGDEVGVRLDQHDADAVVAPFADVLGGGRAAIATTDDDDLRLGRRTGAHAGRGAGAERAEGDAGGRGMEDLSTGIVHVRSPWSALLRREMFGDQLDLPGRVALGDLAHDRGGLA